MHQGRVILLAAGFLALAGPAAGQKFYGDKKYGEFYEEEKIWVEQEAKLPDFPKTHNLIEFDAGAATRNRHYVDGSTLSVGEDGVVRYAVVVRTSGGATNVNYEGIRCSAKERKLYATAATMILGPIHARRNGSRFVRAATRPCYTKTTSARGTSTSTRQKKA